jgi:hypothetical protein
MGECGGEHYRIVECAAGMCVLRSARESGCQKNFRQIFVEIFFCLLAFWPMVEVRKYQAVA